ncbi:MAG: HAMP domain-containing histidine kinase [Erysipelotrichaceae bacterium]|nr:HAMP domain-containing histidine kinase [Erysipelotrichaceae bacterium]
MKKLKNKTCALIFSIFSIVCIAVVVGYNVNTYNQQMENTRGKLAQIERIHRNNRSSKQLVFMDAEAYVVTYTINGDIFRITNYTDNGLTDKEVREMVTGLNLNKTKNIGNLYFNHYVYQWQRSELVILGTSDVQSYLVRSLVSSLIGWIVMEFVFMYISWLLTKWLVKPVEESFEKQQQFIYDASHELKTPLAIILASAEALESDPKETKWLTNIKSESQRMNQLVMDLLELSKLDDMRNKEVFALCDLSEVILTKSLSFESLMFEQQLTLDTQIEEHIMMRCSADRMKELLSILLDNAIKHAFSQSTIVVSLKKEKDTIALAVQNAGEEIPANQRDKIFERFYRVDKSRNRDEGRYGLGLSIAKSIVTSHNGTIGVNCAEGITTFTVCMKQE